VSATEPPATNPRPDPVEDLANAGFPLDADDWYALDLILHGAAHLLGRYARGEASADDEMDRTATELLAEVVGAWETRIERGRPKTAQADLLDTADPGGSTA
jgi:hypothetical protein